jgi:protein deglycase
MPNALIPLAPGCEELEAVTMIDLLRRADFDVLTAGLVEGPITASRRTVLLPDVLLVDMVDQDFDLIALPGGQPGATHLVESRILKRMLERQHERGGWIGAICAAPRVLAVHGLLAGRRATSFPGALDEFDDGSFERADEPVVIDGHIVTSRGPGTAMDFALTLIECCAGSEQRQAVEGPLQRS